MKNVLIKNQPVLDYVVEIINLKNLLLLNKVINLNSNYYVTIFDNLLQKWLGEYIQFFDKLYTIITFSNNCEMMFLGTIKSSKVIGIKINGICTYSWSYYMDISLYNIIDDNLPHYLYPYLTMTIGDLQTITSIQFSSDYNQLIIFGKDNKYNFVKYIINIYTFDFYYGEIIELLK